MHYTLTACLFGIITTFTDTTPAAPPTSFQPRGVGGGGALFSPSFSPHNPNEMFVSCDMSELFHSVDLGANWDLIRFTEIQGNRSTKVEFTTNSLIMYTIDHSNETPTPSRSNDGGLTWTPLSGDPTFGECYWMCADPDNTNRLLVSDYNNVYISTNGGTSFNQRINVAGGGGCYVGGAFWDGTNIFVATSGGLYVSNNSGSSFALSSAQIAGRHIVSMTGAKQGAITRLFATTAPTGDVYPGILLEIDLFGLASPLLVYSLDIGGSWVAKQNGLNADDRIIFLGTARNDISTCYAAGGSSLQDWPAIYKTANAGTNWSSIFLTNNNQNIITGWSGDGGDRGWGYGGGAVGLAVSSVDSSKAAYSDYGFVHLTTDGGTNWKQAYVSPPDQNPAGVDTPVGKAYHSAGIEDTTCWRLTWSNANNIWASFSDIRGIRTTDGGITWSFNYTGHTDNSSYQVVKHPSNGNLYMATSNRHDIYQTTHLTDGQLDGYTGTILLSTNNGLTWSLLHSFGDPVIDLCFDPANANTLYASVIHSTNGGIFRTLNLQDGAASTWSKLTNPPRTQGHPFNIKVLNDGSLVSTYCGRRASNLFTDSSGVFVSTNSGVSWNDRSDTNMHYYVKDIVIDPHDINGNTWYVCVWSGYGGPFLENNQAGGLYRTTNRGVNWTRLNNLYRVSSGTISPTNANEMYITTEQEGLWYTSNLSAVTPTFTQLSSYPFRQPERVYYNPFDTSDLWVTSFGNGIRRGTIELPATVSAWEVY